MHKKLDMVKENKAEIKRLAFKEKDGKIKQLALVYLKYKCYSHPSEIRT